MSGFIVTVPNPDPKKPNPYYLTERSAFTPGEKLAKQFRSEAEALTTIDACRQNTHPDMVAECRVKPFPQP